MNRKQLTILLFLGIVVGGAGFHFYKARKESYVSKDAVTGQKLVPNFPLNDVARLTIKQGTNQLDLVKTDEVWKVRERHEYPANFQEVSEFLRKVWELKTVQNVKIGPSQFGRLELLPPDKGTNSGTFVEFADKSGKAIKSLLLGKKYVRESQGSSPFGGGDYPVGRYIMVVESQPKVWVISDVLSSIEPKPEAWLNKDFFKVEKIRSVSVTHTNATNSWKLSRETESGEFKLADTKEGEALDTSKASGVGYAFSSPSFSDVLSPEAKSEETGLDIPLVAQLETFEDFVYTVKIGKKTGDDNYHLKMSVAANLPKERTPGKDEKPEDKEKLDKEFTDKVQRLEEKLKQEKAYEKWTYLVGKWTVDPVLKERKDFLAEKKEEAKTDKPAEPSQADAAEKKAESAVKKEAPAPRPLPPLPPPLKKEEAKPAPEKPAPEKADAKPKAVQEEAAPKPEVKPPPPPPAPEKK